MTGNGLFGSTTLDVVIGLIFVYLLLAIICTTVNEWIAGILKTRAATLKSAITQLLDSQKESDSSADLNWFLKQFNTHPLIAGLKQAGQPDSHPAYLPARTFATAVIDITTSHKPGAAWAQSGHGCALWRFGHIGGAGTPHPDRRETCHAH